MWNSVMLYSFSNGTRCIRTLRENKKQNKKKKQKKKQKKRIVRVPNLSELLRYTAFFEKVFQARVPYLRSALETSFSRILKCYVCEFRKEKKKRKRTEN